MGAEIVMPKMGESIMEGTILKWHKKPGDSVDVDETILEISTDKVDTEVPSPEAGIISELLYKEGDVVEVGKVIARLESNGQNDAAAEKTEEKQITETKKVEVDLNAVPAVTSEAKEEKVTAQSNGEG